MKVIAFNGNAQRDRFDLLESGSRPSERRGGTGLGRHDHHENSGREYGLGIKKFPEVRNYRD